MITSTHPEKATDKIQYTFRIFKKMLSKAEINMYVFNLIKASTKNPEFPSRLMVKN